MAIAKQRVVLEETLLVIDDLYRFFKDATDRRHLTKSTVCFDHMTSYLTQLEHWLVSTWQVLTHRERFIVIHRLRACFLSIESRPSGMVDAFREHIVPIRCQLSDIMTSATCDHRQMLIELRMSLSPNCRKFFPAVKIS